jgi:cellulose synthase/poly-beta-1,6-N-acetylglucosamine synthase-like glycosyltransferase
MFAVKVVFWAAWSLILYTYVLFPLILALCARRARPKETATDTPPVELPRVAMVVAAFNEARVIANKLTNTWSLDYPADRFQLVVGSDGSSDGTVEILNGCRHPRLRVRNYLERRGKISVLNDLIRETDAEIVVMSDANTMFSPDALRLLVSHFRDASVGCVSGELSLEQEGGVSGEGLYWKYEGWIKRSESRLGFLIGCNGGIYALRRALYRCLPPSTIVEDFVLSMRVLEQGYRVLFEPQARATEPAAPSARAEMVRKVRIGAGGFQALGLTYPMLHPRHGVCAFAFWGHKVFRWCVPLLLVAALAANVALVGAGAYHLLLGLQAAGAIVAGWAYNERAGARFPKWIRPISYFYLMNYALLCGFFRFAFRTQRVTWDRAGH